MRVLVAHDLSKYGDAALQWANKTIHSPEVEMIVVHVGDAKVIPQGQQDGSQTFARLREERAAIDSRISESSSHRDDVSYRALATYGDPAESILKAAREESVDLIVVGSHSRSGMNHLLLGSVAEKIVHKSKIPVLVAKE